MNTDIDILEYEYFLLHEKISNLYKDLFVLGKNKKSYLLNYLKILRDNKMKKIDKIDFHINGDLIEIYFLSTTKETIKKSKIQIGLDEFLSSHQINLYTEIDFETIENWKFLKKLMVSYKIDLEKKIIILKNEIGKSMESQKLILDKLLSIYP